ncbi:MULTISPECIES: hypothetical protein [unclassified Pseudomonas]|uniref:hypothetical protein n=1 Tax=unclassified Pseudomonas TaxID=196821 RepID=UPI0039A49FB2
MDQRHTLQRAAIAEVIGNLLDQQLRGQLPQQQILEHFQGRRTRPGVAPGEVVSDFLEQPDMVVLSDIPAPEQLLKKAVARRADAKPFDDCPAKQGLADPRRSLLIAVPAHAL